ncbi:MAG: ATP-dependent DNA helicase RecG [Clostridia bacterium]|nr:ATP-dependent DNA helicase RecG [Clostridia bacterium]
MRALSEIKGFGPKRLEALEKRGIDTARDLIERLPVGYRDTTRPMSPAQMTEGREGCFEGFVKGKPALHRARGMQWVSATIADECSKIRCMWFNQSWMKDRLFDTQHVVLYGRCVRKKSGLMVINPTIEEQGGIIPAYAPVPGVGQKPLRDAVRLLLNEYDLLDPLPASFISRYQLMDRREALEQAHFPTDFEALARAKERLAFEELLLFQMGVAGASGGRREAQPLNVKERWIESFFARLPYAPTGAQRRVAYEIAEDLRKDRAMARMVQGDVGCGKTMIAFCALYLCVLAGGQGALMAPTEILASQHFQSAVEMLAPLGIACGLVTGRMTAAERRRAREAVASGEWQVIIGTHALISEGLEFENLQLVITDEQHRFGVRQRTRLEGKGISPHVLVMSATPIPRSLSLVLYGDLDISIVDELPPGRTPVKTRIVSEEKREGLYSFIRSEAEKGFQTYVVCPLVGEADMEDPDIRSAAQVQRELTKALAPLSVGLVHGRMKKQEKEDVLERFYAGELNVLVATTVIEVGVNVPRATVMVIEGAERFGLAQLHQLRGRVGRGAQESWCFLMAEPNERLKTLVSTHDGFVVAQKDLEIRGAGEFFGTRQHGEPQMPALMLASDSRLLARTRDAFLDLMKSDEYGSERLQILNAAQERFDRAGTFFARN